MKWLLIMFLVGVRGTGSVTAEFPSMESCMAALEAMKREAAAYGDPYPPSILAICQER